MNRLNLTAAVLTTLLAVCVSCYYDNEEALYPSVLTNCDTTLVTYSGDIVPMLASNCLSCHSNAAAAASGNSIRLENYPDVKANAINAQSAIKHIGPLSPMPKNGGMLSKCLITQFDIWVNNGMLNN